MTSRKAVIPKEENEMDSLLRAIVLNQRANSTTDAAITMESSTTTTVFSTNSTRRRELSLILQEALSLFEDGENEHSFPCLQQTTYSTGFGFGAAAAINNGNHFHSCNFDSCSCRSTNQLQECQGHDQDFTPDRATAPQHHSSKSDNDKKTDMDKEHPSKQ